MATFALGTDTGGSIRQPASFCGITGLKPTYGARQSLRGWWPMRRLWTRSVRWRGTQRIAHSFYKPSPGHDPHDATSLPAPVPDYAAGLNADLAGMRLGVPREYFAEGMDAGVRDAVTSAIDQLAALGAEIHEVSLPTTEYALACYYIIAPSECSANLARYDGVKYGYSHQGDGDMWEAMERTRQHGFGPEVKRRVMLGAFALSSGYYDAYYHKAQQGADPDQRGLHPRV